MSAMDVGNLSRSGVKPLRNTAKAQENPARTFSVEALKNGGTMDMGGMLEKSQTIREQYRGKGPAPSARAAQNSRLSPEEQVEKLGKIRKSAVEYEAVFVDQLVKQMRQSPLAKTAGGDTFSDIAEQPFRDFLSQNGGLGLADTIVGQIARQEGLERTLQENPGVMGPNWRPTVPKNLMYKPAGNLQKAEEPLADKDESMSPLLESMIRGVRNMAGAAGGEKAAGALEDEEISYLYNEAQEGPA
jgi:Rod binding domain-containing protein